MTINYNPEYLDDSLPNELLLLMEKMFKRSQTKVIFPILTYAIVTKYCIDKQRIFSNADLRQIYEQAVHEFKKFLGHDLHIGGMYYDAYPSRNLPKYKVLDVIATDRYRLTEMYIKNAEALAKWLPPKLKNYINSKLGIVTDLGKRNTRIKLSHDKQKFVNLIRKHIDRNPANFEIFCFAVIKVHLEKFACKVYRDTRTSAHDSGVDLSTNFGVVYQIKKMKLLNMQSAKKIYSELRTNFDKDRLSDGNVILIIDDISNDIKKYLIDMKIQSIKKDELINMAVYFEDVEDREKVLRIIYEEYRREYASVI